MKTPERRSTVSSTVRAARVRSIRVLDELFSDISVPAETTLDLLRELREDLNMKINCLETDLKAKAKATNG